MTARHHKNEVYLAIKAATRRAVRAFGGAEALSADTRISRPIISRAGSIAEDDTARFAPLDMVADVDAGLVEAGGRPVITEFLAALNGFALVRLAQQSDQRLAVAHTLKETGEVVAVIGRALADDEVSAAEAAAIRREAVQAIEAMQDLIKAMDEGARDATDK